MSLLPRRVESAIQPSEPRVLGIDCDDADRAFDVLTSETARGILSAVYETPRTPPELRDEVGTSLQNVHYHLDRLESSELIEPAGVGYSEKGNEMTVYGPASEAVLLVADSERERSRLRRLLARAFGLVAVALAATAGFAVALDRFVRTESAGDPQSFDSGGSPGVEDAAAPTVAEVSREAAGFDPALAFLLGALTVTLVVCTWWVLRER